MFVLASFAALICRSAADDPARQVTRSYDAELDMLQFVSADLGDGCRLSMEVHDKSGPSGPPYLMFRTSNCADLRPSMTTEMTAIDDLLHAAVLDGRNLRLIQTVMPVMRPEWIQKYVDCYVSVNGIENRRRDNPKLDKTLAQCDVTPELNSVFAKYGIKVRFSGGEKAWWFDCQRPERNSSSSGWRLDERWLAKYRGHHCGLHVPTMWWFRTMATRSQ